MPWIQLALTTTKPDSEELADILTELGAVSVTFQDAGDEPILEPAVGETPLWQHTNVTALFDESVDKEQLIKLLASRLSPLPVPEHTISLLQDKVWEREWMKDFHAMQFGRRTWICPSWQPPPDPDAVNILLDPGLAFGTGTHPTTALCLEWLDYNIQGGEIVIDLGCGSGVLAICALKLGASKVIAIDNDPQALSATRDNADKNQVLNDLELATPDKTPAVKADIIVANILARPLVSLAENLSNGVKPGGYVVLSGILDYQEQMVTEAYRPWFSMKHCEYREQWVRLDLVRTK